jgi:hypothetical protein
VYSATRLEIFSDNYKLNQRLTAPKKINCYLKKKILTFLEKIAKILLPYSHPAAMNILSSWQLREGRGSSIYMWRH